MMRKKIQNFSGFTFVELIVVIAIMSILGIVALANFKTLQNDQSLNNGVNELIAFLRIAQTNATSRVECSVSNNPTQGGALWRVVFDNDKKIAKLVCQLGWDGAQSGTIKQITLKGNVEIQSIRGVDPINTVIFFNPVYGDAVFATCSSTCSALTDTKVTFRIRHIPTNTTKDFILDKGGSIDVQ